MATARASIAIEAPKGAVFALIRDQAQRRRFLPDGWRQLRTLSEQTDVVGSRMEVEARLGPGLTTQVIEILEMTEDQIVEGPPTRDNFITTWTLGESGGGTIVELETVFSYGEWFEFALFGEWLVKRRLRRAHRQMLQRLKAVAEGASTGEVS